MRRVILGSPKDIFDGEIELDGFVSHRSDRSNRSNGGVIMYVKTILNSTKVLEYLNSKCKAVGVLLDKK